MRKISVNAITELNRKYKYFTFCLVTPDLLSVDNYLTHNLYHYISVN